MSGEGGCSTADNQNAHSADNRALEMAARLAPVAAEITRFSRRDWPVAVIGQLVTEGHSGYITYAHLALGYSLYRK